MTEERVAAIARNVGFGCRDVGAPVLFFDAYIDEASAALQVIPAEKALAVIRATGVYDVKDLEGKPLWVTRGPGTIHFEAFWK